MLRIVRQGMSRGRKVVNRLRKLKVTLTCASVGEGLLVLGRSSVSSKTTIGDYSSTNGMVVKGTGVLTMGSYVHTGEGVLIITSNHDYDTADVLPYGHQNAEKDVKIGDFVWIGDRVIILPGIEIGEGAILQAGGVFTKDVPALAIAGGNPAAVFRSRDAEHFDRLKEEGRFLTW